MKFELLQECVAKNLLFCFELVLHIQGTQITVSKLNRSKAKEFEILRFIIFDIFFILFW